MLLCSIKSLLANAQSYRFFEEINHCYSRDSKLRSLVYGVTASMCALLDGLNERPEKANEDSGMIAEERITQEAAVDNHHDAAAHATAASLASLLAAAANASSSTTSSLNASIGQKRKRNVPAKRTAIAPAAAAVSAPLSTHGSIMKDEIADGTSEFHDDDVNLEMQSDDDVSMEDVIVEVGVREDAAPAREVINSAVCSSGLSHSALERRWREATRKRRTLEIRSLVMPFRALLSP